MSMTFIDLTRLGGLRVVRLRANAIAYLDPGSDGCNVKLIGGETLRVNEDAAEIERRCGEPPATKRRSGKAA